MTDDRPTISNKELPDLVLEKSSRLIQKYTTGLIQVCSQRGVKENHTYIGSGTFVHAGNSWGILTAYHVAKEVNRDCDLGFLLSEGQEQKTVIPCSHLKVIDIGIPNDPGHRPDLSFILIPSTYVGTIKSVKSFYNLEIDQIKFRETPPELIDGFWFLCGLPGEKMSIEKSEIDSFSSVLTFQMECGATGPDREYSIDGFDYLDVVAEYISGNIVPVSYEGYSGGGLWQIPIIIDGNHIEARDYIFSGVAFYQTAIKNGRRLILCHGRKSVYGRAYDAIIQHE